jgi:hypothetical protein
MWLIACVDFSSRLIGTNRKICPYLFGIIFPLFKNSSIFPETKRGLSHGCIRSIEARMLDAFPVVFYADGIGNDPIWWVRHGLILSLKKN